MDIAPLVMPFRRDETHKYTHTIREKPQVILVESHVNFTFEPETYLFPIVPSVRVLTFYTLPFLPDSKGLNSNQYLI